MKSKIELENNFYVKKWLENKAKNSPSTYNVYRTAFRKYLEFTKQTVEELIEEINEEFKKPVTERGEIKRKVKAFYYWAVEKGLGEKSAMTYLGAVESFYSNFNFSVRASKEIKAAPKHRKVNLTPEDVRKMVNHAKYPRDRAIILVLAQSGMDVSTLCGLKVRDVWKGLQDGEVPLRIHLIRRKEKVEYDTFLAYDAIEALKTYLKERQAKEGKLDLDSPLFVKEGTKRKKIEPLKPALIEKVFRQIAVESGLVSGQELKKTGWNPYRPHALRRFFADRLRVAGVNEEVINFMLGHVLRYRGSYFGEAYNQYKENMHVLAIFQNAETMIELKEKLKEQDELIRGLQNTITQLTSQNLALENRLRQIELRLQQPIGAIDVRTASFLVDLLKMAKSDPTIIDSAIQMLEEGLKPIGGD